MSEINLFSASLTAIITKLIDITQCQSLDLGWQNLCFNHYRLHPFQYSINPFVYTWLINPTLSEPSAFASTLKLLAT